MNLKITKKGNTLYIGKGLFRTPKLKLATPDELSQIIRELKFFRNNGEEFIYTVPSDITSIRSNRDDLFLWTERSQLVFRGWLVDKVDRDAVWMNLWDCNVKQTYAL